MSQNRGVNHNPHTLGQFHQTWKRHCHYCRLPGVSVYGGTRGKTQMRAIAIRSMSIGLFSYLSFRCVIVGPCQCHVISFSLKNLWKQRVIKLKVADAAQTMTEKTANISGRIGIDPITCREFRTSDLKQNNIE